MRSVAPEMMNAIQSHQRQLIVDDCAIQPPTMGEKVVPPTHVNNQRDLNIYFGHLLTEERPRRDERPCQAPVVSLKEIGDACRMDGEDGAGSQACQKATS